LIQWVDQVLGIATPMRAAREPLGLKSGLPADWFDALGNPFMWLRLFLGVLRKFIPSRLRSKCLRPPTAAW